jgi:uroporphyrinogen III methyltransferase/synthase
MKKPFVYLVGAGPGDAGLITLKGMHCLSIAECVIYDGLVNPRILDYVSTKAEKIAVAKRGGKNSIPQEQINDLLVSHAMSGQTVVRLKGGDPTLFARAAEEVKVLREAGIGFEIVPGITSGIAAAEYSGIFLTDRELSSQVVFVTGHPAAGKDMDFIDWNWLGRFDGTIVLYMAMSNLEGIVARLLSAGKSADMPAVVIQDATLPTQKVAKGALKNIDAICKKEGISSPAIVIIGKAADINPANDWFMTKPLFGRAIVITRDKAGNQRLGRMLEQEAANVIDFPCIEIQGPMESQSLNHAIRDMNDYDWIVFTSLHGVDFTFELLRKKNKDSRALGSARIACIGDHTARALLKYGIAADFVPTEFTAKALVDELAAKYDLRRKNTLLLRSAIAADDLANDLRQKGAAVEDIRIYTTVSVVQDEAKRTELAEMLRAGKVDWITFTSSSTVDGFLQNVDAETVKQANIKIASIGPETTKKLCECGLPAHIEALVHTAEGLVETITDCELKGRVGS